MRLSFPDAATLLDTSNDSSARTAQTKNKSQDGGGGGGGGLESYSSNPGVFNFYNYLRTHPLIVRQQLASMAADKSTAQTVLLSGFSYGAAHASSSATGDKNVTCVDKITPLERRYD